MKLIYLKKNILFLFLFFASFSQAQIVYEGNITESNWGTPLGSSSGGPTSSCFSPNGIRLNTLYATANDTTLEFAIGGNIQHGYNILLFLDTKTGGYNNADFGRNAVPACLLGLPKGTGFDVGFFPDYCIIISSDNSNNNYYFNLVTLGGNVNNGGSNTISIGKILNGISTPSTGFQIGANPSISDYTRGFEISIPRNILGYLSGQQQVVKMMAMIANDAGQLDNQFISKALPTQGCFGFGPSGNGVQFQNELPDPVEFNPTHSLPIDFVYTRVAQVGVAIRVFWASALETQMKEYQIERSENAIDFVSIATVPATGTSGIQTDYSFPDINPIVGKNFYRIKAIDKNGRSTYSIVVKINYGHVDNTLTIFPNPVKDVINLQIVALKPGVYDLEVFNDAGQRLIRQSIIYNGGYGLQQIPIPSNMQKGPYRLLLSNDAVFYKQNFLVQ